MKTILAYGTIASGLTFVGPFDSKESAEEYHNTLGYIGKEVQYIYVQKPLGLSWMEDEFNSNQKKYVDKSRTLAQAYAKSEGMSNVPNFLIELAHQAML